MDWICLTNELLLISNRNGSDMKAQKMLKYFYKIYK